MSTIKFDPGNPAVIVLIIGVVWFYSKNAKASQRAKIGPQQAATAPVKSLSKPLIDASSLDTFVTRGVPSLVDWVKSLNGSSTPTPDAASLAAYNAIGQVDYYSPQAAAASLSDDLGVRFGGFAPRFNSDNLLGGSSFLGIPSVGTGLDPYLIAN